MSVVVVPMSRDWCTLPACRYFVKWDRLLASEEGTKLAADAELWATPAHLRAKQGRCAHNLRLRSCRAAPAPRDAASQLFTPVTPATPPHASPPPSNLPDDATEYVYTFEVLPPEQTMHTVPGGRHGASSTSHDRPSLLELALSVGDWVIASVHSGHVAVLRGTIARLTRSTLSLRAVQKPSFLLPGATATSSAVGKRIPSTKEAASHIPMGHPVADGKQAGVGVPDIEDAVGSAGPRPGAMRQQVAVLQRFVWRVDKGELTSSVKLLRSNLVNLIAGPTIEWGDGMDRGDDNCPGSSQSKRAAEPKARSCDENIVPGTATAPNARQQGVVGGGGGGASKRKPPPQSAPTFGDVKRKRLIIDLAPPRFSTASCLPWEAPTVPPSAVLRCNEWLPLASPAELQNLRTDYERLNDDQVRPCVCVGSCHVRSCVSFVMSFSALSCAVTLCVCARCVRVRV